MERNEYIEFDIKDEDKFKDLRCVFKEIRESKENEDYKSDEYWLALFPNYALKTFCFAESDFKPDFETLSIDFSSSHWHFYSLIEHLIENVDVIFLDCENLGNAVGRLNFYANGYPYGGISGMTMFVKAFNCIATIIDEGGGIYKVKWISEDSFELEDITYQNDVISITEKESFWNKLLIKLRK